MTGNANVSTRGLGLELDGDFLCQVVEWLLQQVIKPEAEQKIGAAKHEQAAKRLGNNGLQSPT